MSANDVNMSFTSNQLNQIRQQIVTATGQPKSITVDGETFTQHALAELLQAYKLAQSSSAAAASRATGGIVFRKLVPSGAA